MTILRWACPVCHFSIQPEMRLRLSPQSAGDKRRREWSQADFVKNIGRKCQGFCLILLGDVPLASFVSSKTKSS
eukprot:4212686-Amphidinium_carterae.2